MNATQHPANLREVRGTQASHQTIWNRLHQHGLCARWPARVPDHTTRHRRHRLAWAKEHLHWTRDQWASVLFSDESRFTVSRNDGQENAMHQPLLSPEEPLMVVLQCGQVCLVNIDLHYTFWMVHWQAHTTWITSLIQSLCPCMNNIGLISSSWTTMLPIIEGASLGNGCWRLGYSYGMHFLQTWIP